MFHGDKSTLKKWQNVLRKMEIFNLQSYCCPFKFGLQVLPALLERATCLLPAIY